MFELKEEFPTLYKRGVKGEVRVWRMELGVTKDEDAGHRVVSGIQGGAMTESGWNRAEPKNEGKKNATTSFTQAVSEIGNNYDIKRKNGYFDDVANIDKVPYFKPMLATDYDKRVGKWDFPVFAQPKLDGMRCIARADGLWTRTGKPIVSVPHVWEALAPAFEADPDLILDGELYNHDLKDNFNELISICRKAKPKPEDIEKAKVIQYHVYDMPSAPGVTVERLTALSNWMDTYVSDTIRMVQTRLVHTQDMLDALNREWLKDGYEGQMVRLPEGYQNKRSNFLLKRKQWLSDEFPVVEMIEGQGNWAGAAKTAVVALPNGTTGEATFTGEYDKLAELLASGHVPDWATVKYFGFTPDGKLRFPNVMDYGYGERDY